MNPLRTLHPTSGASDAEVPLPVDRSTWAVESLAAAVASITISSGPPLLSHSGIGSRPAQTADVESRWFAYWSRELGTAPAANPDTWRLVVALQVLYEAGALRPDAVVDLRSPAPQLVDYLRSLDIRVGEAERADALMDLSGNLSAPPALARVGVWFVDLALEGPAKGAFSAHAIQSFGQECVHAGWAVAAMDFTLGVHPLDRFVAAAAEPIDARTPSLRHLRDGAVVTPFIVIARRDGEI